MIEQDDPVQAALRKARESALDPVQQALVTAQRTPPKGVRSPVEIAQINATEKRLANQGGFWQSLAETTASGQPGGLAAVSGYRGLLGDNPTEAAAQANEDVARFSADYPRTALAAKMVGAAPTALATGAAKLAQYGPRVAGALIGAGSAGAQRLFSTEHPDESLSDRLVGTAKDAALGGAAGFALPTLLANPVTRTAIGAGAGAWLAPEGHRTEGALAGGLLSVSPSKTAKVVADATGRIAPRLSSAARTISEATGLRGDVNREMAGIQSILTPVGGKVGAAQAGSTTLLGAKEARSAASELNYGTAAREGDAALTAYRAHRGATIGENVRRMLNVIRRDAEDVAAAENASQMTTAQSPRPSLREAIDNFRERLGESARRQTPRISESPFVRNVRAETATQGNIRPSVDRMIAAEGPPPRPSSLMESPPRPALPDQLPVPPAVHPEAARLYENPTIAKVANGLHGLDEFRGMDLDDPRMLDAIYKVFSDQKGALATRIEGAVGDRSVNLGRFTKTDIEHAQRQILRTADSLMPTYRTAVNEHAAASRWMDAFRRGYDAMKGTDPKAKGLLSKTPAALESWISSETDPNIRTAVEQGAKAAAVDVAGKVPLTAGRAGLLTQSPFKESAADEARRGLTGSPNLSSAVNKVTQAVADQGKKVHVYLPGTKGHVASAAMESMRIPVMEKAGAKKIVGQILANPEAYQTTLARYGTGAKTLDAWLRMLQSQVGNAIGR